jgi:hypothetical protein
MFPLLAKLNLRSGGSSCLRSNSASSSGSDVGRFGRVLRSTITSRSSNSSRRRGQDNHEHGLGFLGDVRSESGEQRGFGADLRLPDHLAPLIDPRRLVSLLALGFTTRRTKASSERFGGRSENDGCWGEAGGIPSTEAGGRTFATEGEGQTRPDSVNA